MFILQEISILTYLIIASIKKVQIYLNLIYQNSFIPTVNKPMRVTMKTSTIIDHVPTIPMSLGPSFLASYTVKIS